MAVDAGATLTAAAALLTAFTGMISAGVAAVITLRRRRLDTQTASEIAVSRGVAAELARLLREQEEESHHDPGAVG